jgi:hypothetical protein
MHFMWIFCRPRGSPSADGVLHGGRAWAEPAAPRTTSSTGRGPERGPSIRPSAPRATVALPQAGAEETSVAPQAAASTEPMKEKTPRGDFRRVAREDVRLRRVRPREVWRQAAGAGVYEGRGWSARDSGAPGPGPGGCEAGPGARAPPERVVSRLKSPPPGEPGPCRARPRRRPGSGRRVHWRRIGSALARRAAHGLPVSAPHLPLRSPQ